MPQDESCLPRTLPSALATSPFFACCLLLLSYPPSCCGFYGAHLLQEALQDCTEEPVWLCLDSRYPLFSFFPSPGRDAIKRETSWVKPRSREGESLFQGASPNGQHCASHKPFSCHPGFFLDARSSLSFSESFSFFPSLSTSRNDRSLPHLCLGMGLGWSIGKVDIYRHWAPQAKD